MERTPQHQDPHPEASPKQLAWEQQLAFLDAIEDERPIDGNIKETLVGLNLHGIHTVASCGGHPLQERKTGDTPYPWVLIAPPDEAEDKKRSLVLQEKTNTLLTEFYKQRQADQDSRLTTSGISGDQFTLSSIEDRKFLKRLANNELTEEEKTDLVIKLPKRQQEMQDFGQFLKSKFFANE